jgi:hypothetical protein
MFKLIRKAAALARMCPILDLNCEENAARANRFFLKGGEKKGGKKIEFSARALSSLDSRG